MKIHEYAATARAFGRDIDVEFDGERLIIQGLTDTEARWLVRWLEQQRTARSEEAEPHDEDAGR